MTPAPGTLEAGRLRMDSPPGAEVVLNGRPYLYFAGTAYLGLQSHPQVIEAACAATRLYGLASATSRSGAGNMPPTLEVEQNAARFFGAEEAFFFVSGYVGNLILAQALGDDFDVVFVDELSHYSVFDAIRTLRIPHYTFRHREAADLRSLLRNHLAAGQRPLVMSDAVFAVLGDVAPVESYIAQLREYPGSALCLDDAHGAGVLGANGRGTFEYFSHPPAAVNTLENAAAPRLLSSTTLSKALGGFGGMIAGSRDFIAKLKGGSHFYDGANPPPVPVAAASATAIRLLIEQPQFRGQLQQNVRSVREGLRGMGLDVDDSPVPIICLGIGDAENMRRIQRQLMDRGVYVPHIAAYSGLGPQGGLRLAVCATHTEAMIGRLLDELRRAV